MSEASQSKPPVPGPTAPAKVASASRLGRIAPILVFVAIAGMFAYSLRSGDPSKLPSALIGKPVPKFQLPAVDGLRSKGNPVAGFANNDLAKGKVSVINFWASWCGPCHEEHPFLVELAKTSKAPLFGVNYKDRASAARRFLGRYGNPFVAVGADGNGRTAIDWGVYGMPETFIVNGRGQIIYKHVGPIDATALKERLLPAIAKAQEAGKTLQGKAPQ